MLATTSTQQHNISHHSERGITINYLKIAVRNSMVFQPHETPAHFCTVRNFLNVSLSPRWIDQDGLATWLARSPIYEVLIFLLGISQGTHLRASIWH
ncbi:hypothetical protein CEXT_635281 [Caerostris extrusa]|uniref:Uncharacterized protein n=1 Tax=Caerostris extrusa TaxID=172846 RepID=A0AAV4U1Y0_CAEEX|nr:hypothetical protein CEXT_635281 [Caerostris extrusa]